MPRKKLNGVYVPHLKNTAEDKPQRMPTPPIVTIPMSMHVGAPAKPVVSVGDVVKVGQMIAEADGFVSATINASVSGRIKKIDEMLISNGQYLPAITIEADGEQTPFEGLSPPVVTNLGEFIAAIRSGGIVGLGGAGFPTAVKLSVEYLSKIEAIIVNGAECEPYISSDTRTMLDDAKYLWKGVELLQKYLQAKRVILAIEDNKPQCIKLYKQKCKSSNGVEVKALPSIYPQGGEKVLIYNTIGKVVPEGKLPISVGAVVINCTTLASIAKYMETGMPLVEKCVTVDGSAVCHPKNVIAPVGTPIKDVFDFCGGFIKPPKKVLYGGPMMGIAVPDLNVPVLKNTNALVALAEEDALLPEPTACIRCGRCIAHCPLRLMPIEIESAYKSGDVDGLAKLKVKLCMECGCCAYVCPASRPLVQVNKLAKVMLREHQQLEKARVEAKRFKDHAKKQKENANNG